MRAHARLLCARMSLSFHGCKRERADILADARARVCATMQEKQQQHGDWVSSTHKRTAHILVVDDGAVMDTLDVAFSRTLART